jgi:hypothetical protein
VIARFCAVCGQERDTHRRSLGDLLHDVLKELASFDSRILRTAGALLAEPGELPLAFHEGRTRRYVPAVRLYLMVSLLFFVTLSLTHVALVQVQLRVVPNAYVVRQLPDGDFEIVAEGASRTPIPRREAMHEVTGSLTPGPHAGISTDVHFFAPIGRFHPTLSPEGMARIEQGKQAVLKLVGDDRNGWMARNAIASLEKLAHDPAALNEPLTTWIPRVLFLLLPAFALVLALFYVRQRKQFYFVDHLVFSLSMHSFVFAVLILAIGAAQILPGPVVAQLVGLSAALYLLVSLKRFYKQGWAITVAKFVAIVFVYWVVFLVPALIAAVVTGMVAG